MIKIFLKYECIYVCSSDHICAYTKSQYPTQVAGIAVYFQWTKDCENALSQCRYDRRAIPNARSKFINLVINRLCTQLTKNKWRHTEIFLSMSDRAKLESLAMVHLYILMNIHTRTHLYAHMHAFTHMRAHTHTHVCTHMYAHIYTYMHTCYPHIHSHTFTYLFNSVLSLYCSWACGCVMCWTFCVIRN